MVILSEYSLSLFLHKGYFMYLPEFEIYPFKTIHVISAERSTTHLFLLYHLQKWWLGGTVLTVHTYISEKKSSNNGVILM